MRFAVLFLVDNFLAELLLAEALGPLDFLAEVFLAELFLTEALGPLDFLADAFFVDAFLVDVRPDDGPAEPVPLVDELSAAT